MCLADLVPSDCLNDVPFGDNAQGLLVPSAVFRDQDGLQVRLGLEQGEDLIYSRVPGNEPAVAIQYTNDTLSGEPVWSRQYWWIWLNATRNRSSWLNGTTLAADFADFRGQERKGLLRTTDT